MIPTRNGKMYLIVFTKQADKDKKLLKNAGLKQKAQELLNIIAVNPFQEPPSYEKLLGGLSSYYSRRINLYHRLAYRVDENAQQFKDDDGNLYEGIITVKRMWSHYEKLRMFFAF